MNRCLLYILFLMLTLTFQTSLKAEELIEHNLKKTYTYSNGKLVQSKFIANLSVEEHFELGKEAFENEEWEAALLQFRTVVTSFPKTEESDQSHYYLGMSFYHVGEIALANSELSAYLKLPGTVDHFFDALEGKFLVAEKFRLGAKKYLFNLEKLPKWISAHEDAIDNYDEIIQALPAHELTVKSLFGKAQTLSYLKEYKESIETYEEIIHRFSSNFLVPECYLAISGIYKVQASKQYQNPDLLVLAQMNVKHFLSAFPQDPRVLVAKQEVEKVEEAYAKGLFETALFYERVNQPRASVIYYANVIKQFPKQSVAQDCRKKLMELETKYRLIFLKIYE